MKPGSVNVKHYYRDEIRVLSAIALPLIFSLLISMGISITDVIMTG